MLVFVISTVNGLQLKGGKDQVIHHPFSMVSKSCLKQVFSAPEITTASAETRAENERLQTEVVDSISDFSFCNDIQKHIPKDYRIVYDTNNIYISKTDAKGRSIIQFLRLQFAKSSFGFLYLKCAEKNERKYLKHIFLKLVVCKRIAFLVNGPNLIKLCHA